MKLISGNDLKTGAVVWWTGSDWSIRIEDAVDAGEGAEAIATREEAARRVNVPYVVAAEPGPDGAPRPAHIKERVRALGPTVRPDLTLKPDDPGAVEKVI
ncbi:DUF2849 domain-containing protein [Alteriqipengyuania lutimaris]|uniref:DUF2849 domain-containing protein n=1 Tax=Alteriqipengyuania lutimaris TaxID=1538146 RepID=A0A395LKZ6_9SPHN|nr:DUF2849 domain-containing protein [Alteriqipengyuania lutimaris]MBB3033373.1 hypothetical protein [Alteriqipengyuania lutimaris]RDS77602.1 DUF2849 domain-containing protein [Alteriqipengyuania lutimaris]